MYIGVCVIVDGREISQENLCQSDINFCFEEYKKYMSFVFNYRHEDYWSDSPVQCFTALSLKYSFYKTLTLKNACWRKALFDIRDCILKHMSGKDKICIKFKA